MLRMRSVAEAEAMERRKDYYVQEINLSRFSCFGAGPGR